MATWTAADADYLGQPGCCHPRFDQWGLICGACAVWGLLRAFQLYLLCVSPVQWSVHSYNFYLNFLRKNEYMGV